MSQRSIFEKQSLLIPVILGVSVFVLLTLLGAALLNDPDTYWHIATGRWVLEHGGVPNSDPFSHTIPGADWHAHEWLSGVMLALAHAVWGWKGVVIFTSAMVGLTVGMLAWGTSKYLRNFYVIVIPVIALVAFSPHILARPHVLVMPVLMLWVVLLVFARSARKAPSFFVAFLMIPWANMHGSFPIGLGVAGLLAAEAFFDEQENAGRLAVVKRWGWFLAIATLASLATPYGIQGFLYPFQLSGMERTLTWVAEWQPLNFSKPGAVEGWVMGVLAVLLFRGIKLSFFRLLIFLGLLSLTLAHLRMAEYLLFIASMLVVPVIAKQWSDAPYPASLGLSRINVPILIATIFGFAIIGSIAMLAERDVAPSKLTSPVAALAAAKKAGFSDKPVLNSYNFGGYLIFEKVPVFFDSRADLYGDAFMDRTFSASNLTAASPNLNELLKEYEIEWTIVGAADNAARFLDKEPNWVEFYRDDVAVVHIPKS